jgi:hypothetical protein
MIELVLDQESPNPGRWNPVEMKEAQVFAELAYRMERGKIEWRQVVLRAILNGKVD